MTRSNWPQFEAFKVGRQGHLRCNRNGCLAWADHRVQKPGGELMELACKHHAEEAAGKITRKPGDDA